jgi:DivIVA domain-containing protein
MANSEMRGNQSENEADTAVPPGREGGAMEHIGLTDKEGGRSSGRFSRSRVISATERDRMLKEARDVDFPVGLRGYERAAVDRYVERVNRLLAELEMSSSPESAVRHALDEVSEETRDILQHAHQTADEITARSRGKADDRLQQAERESQEIREAAQQEAQETRDAAHHEAHELRQLTASEAQNLREVTQREVQDLRETAQRETSELRDATTQETADLKERSVREAQQLRASAQREADETREAARREADEMLDIAETRTHDLARSAEAIWRERRRLIDDMRDMGEQLVSIGEAEGKRFARLGEVVPLGDEPTHEQPSTGIGHSLAQPHESART